MLTFVRLCACPSAAAHQTPAEQALARLQRGKASAVIFSKCGAAQRDKAAAKPPLPVGASRVGSPAPHPGTHSWWSCWQLEPQPAWASPESRVPRAGRCCLGVTFSTPPCSHLGIRGLLQPAPTSELRCCNWVFPALLQLKKKKKKRQKKLIDSSLFQIWASPQDFPKLSARQPAFTAGY